MITKEFFTQENDNFKSDSYFVTLNANKYLNKKDVDFKESVNNIVLYKKICEYIDIKPLFNSCKLSVDNKIMFWLNIDEKNNETRQFFIRYTEDFNFNEFYETVLKPFIKTDTKKLPKFNLIAQSGDRITTITRNLKKEITIDLDNAYNTNYPINSIIELLNSDKSGLVLLSGNPGTGKSYLIKYFTQLIQSKDFYFLPNNNLYILSHPSFVNFCLENLQDSVLILEDCELALKSRTQGGNLDVSTILNLTDGIIGDLLNIKIIATLNTTDKIDSALLRKGRMLANCEFKPLSIEKASNIAKMLGKDIDILKETCLCDIYNAESNGVYQVKETKLGY